MLSTTKNIQHFIKRASDEHLATHLNAMHSMDIADSIAPMKPEEILRVIDVVGGRKSSEVFMALDPYVQKSCIEYATAEKMTHYFKALSTDDASRLFQLLDPHSRDVLINNLKPADRSKILELASFENNTAGSVMTNDFFTLPQEMTAAEAVDEIKRRHKQAESIYILYVEDSSGRLSGVVSLKNLLLADSASVLKKIMNPNVITASVHDGAEDVARKISRYDLIALPVVDGERRLVGVVTVDDVIDIIEENATEDYYALGAAGTPIDYASAGVLAVSRQRIFWLLSLSVSGFIAGLVLELFKSELAAYIPLAFFLPLLNGSAGNAATQTTTVITRGLATGEILPAMMGGVVWKEFRVGLLVGSAMAALAAFRAIVLNHNTHLAVIVAGSMIAVVTFAKTVGAMLPLVLRKLGRDPAIVSGPLMSSMLDILSIVIYLGLVRLFLPGL